MESFIDRAKRVINENQELFEALEELDRTGKLRKVRYKERFNFTIDEETMNQFRSYCQKNNIKMSAIIEALIKQKLMDTQNYEHKEMHTIG